jgi:uncharacterized glyoxalase superfamily protein PhnB
MRSYLLVAVAVVGSGCHKDKPDPLAATAQACRDAELSCPRPILSVNQFKASQAYYRDALGFAIAWEHGDPPNFGAVRRSETELFMCERCQGQPGSWTMIFAHDIDALYKEFISRKAIIKMPPTNMPWGLREMHVADPDGNVLRFGASLDDH